MCLYTHTPTCTVTTQVWRRHVWPRINISAYHWLRSVNAYMLSAQVNGWVSVTVNEREREPVIKHSLAVGRVTVWAGGGERERERNISHLCVYALYSVRKASNRETGCMMSSRGIFTDGMQSLQEMSTLWLPSLMILSDLWRTRSELAFPPEESVSRVSLPSQTDRVNWRTCQSSAPKNKDLKNAGVPLSALTASASLLVRTAGQVCVGGCVFL